LREFSSIQEKILDKTLYLIGQKGSYDVSIRDITRLAEVNVNAINYYFGNKENLIDSMEAFFIENYLAAYSVLDDDIEDGQKLLLWANEVIEYTLQYPGIQVILRDNMQGKNSNGKIAHFLIEQSYALNQKVEELLKRFFCVEGENLKLTRIAFESAILHPASFGTTQNFDLTEFKEKPFRLRYISFVIELLKKGIKSL
jgi:Transcriptional regulator